SPETSPNNGLELERPTLEVNEIIEILEGINFRGNSPQSDLVGALNSAIELKTGVKGCLEGQKTQSLGNAIAENSQLKGELTDGQKREIFEKMAPEIKILIEQE
ncbi:MAG: hypothetical protein JW816_03820, partial [Candidatus Buchananbacteria bacterium]|nr:hypothetical protein [Candidatus Buchananbacteria bacterium]